MAESKALAELKSFLNKLFQFESQDLDFGIYKILHYKRKEVKQFIDKLLTDKVKEQLQVFDADQKQILKNTLTELEADEIIISYNEALLQSQADADVIYKYNKTKIVHYLQLSRQYEAADKADNTEQTIYNHLTLFFSRYYDKGDFISKRRFGKNEKYVVPYNGEETHFYWANHDQYYIKSSEYFQQFAFKVPQLKGTLTVNFKLAEAQTEQGNVKADENKYFVLSEKPAELSDTELNIFFEFRSLTETEKKSFTGNGKQDILNEKAVAAVKEQIGKKDATAELWKEDEKEQPLLLRKLNHYTRKNSYDFFIHKDLKGFLQRELDFYIKSELVKVEDLYVLESEQHFDNIRHNFKLIKSFKNIADTIIDFLAQIEEFQKKLWEKKKFVLNTEWVITIDKLAAWLDKDVFENIAKQVIGNKEQTEEWKQLFGWDKLPFALTMEGLKADLHEWFKLPVDTKHFNAAFKESLLNALSEKINIEVEVNGLVIHSDNYHGLHLIKNKFHNQVKCIHIDPPYNTTTSGFLYKNNYKHSSWLALMENRLEFSLGFLTNDASYLCHIDENEYENLYSLLESYNLPNAGTVVWDKRNPMNGSMGLAMQHEYIIWRTNQTTPIYISNNAIASMLLKVEELIRQEKIVNEKVRKEYSSWINKNLHLSGGEKAYRYIDDKGEIFQSVSLRAPEPRSDDKFHIPLIHPITKKPCAIPPNGFSRTPETLELMIKNGEIIFGNDEKTQPRQKVLLTKETQRQFPSIIQNGKKGKADTAPLGLDFPYCHPVSLYEELMKPVIYQKNSISMDFFAGSGTSFHAVQVINKDEGSRKCILLEQGIHFYVVILPRIKKIAYSFDWKDGKPQNMNGLGVFIKYQRLEQYEEALENIAFTATEKTVQQAMAFDNYIPKYFLELETRGSKTLVNIAAMQNPWAYTLKVWDGFTYDTEQPVDLIDTFNYLIGLHVQKYFTWDTKGKKYVFVWGWNNEQKKSLVIWRDITGWKEKEYEKDQEYIESRLPQFEYDNLYINGQSTLPGSQMIEDIFKTKMIPV